MGEVFFKIQLVEIGGEELGPLFFDALCSQGREEGLVWLGWVIGNGNNYYYGCGFY